MKTIENMIIDLQQINEEIIKKDNLINKYNKMFKIVNKFINDNQFINSDSYIIFKNNYINDFTKMFNEINSINSLDIEPQVVIKYKKTDQSSTTTKSEQDSESTKSNIIINNFNPYLPKSTTTLPKVQTKQIKTKTNMYVLLFDDKTKYLLNPNNLNIYSMQHTLIGKLDGNKVIINDMEYNIDTIDINTLNNTISYNKITEDHIILHNIT